MEKISEFNQCPMIYKYRHLMKIDRQDISIEKEYHTAIRKTIMFFYYQVLNGRPPGVEQLRQKFGTILYKDATVEDVLIKNTFDSNFNTIVANGAKTLTAFHEREAEKEYVPIIVDADLKVPIGNHIVENTIDLVREVKDKGKVAIEVVRFTGNNRKIDTFFINHHMGLTADAYTFRKLFQAQEDRVVLQHMKFGKEIYALRREPEFKRLEALVNGVCDAIERHEFYPVHNTQCNSCLYRDVCDKYKF